MYLLSRKEEAVEEARWWQIPNVCHGYLHGWIFHPSDGITENVLKDTFKGSLFGCQENVSNTTLTIVCTINVSIDWNWFQVPNPSTRKNILKKNQSNGMLGLCFVF